MPLIMIAPRSHGTLTPFILRNESCIWMCVAQVRGRRPRENPMAAAPSAASPAVWEAPWFGRPRRGQCGVGPRADTGSPRGDAIREEPPMYIGIGTLVVIVLIVLIILFLRR